MSARRKNLRVTERCDVPVKGVVFELLPGDHAVTEHIADRVVAAGKGRRLIQRGERLKTAEADDAQQ
ncbi:MAG: hypothetical protein LCH38_10805 [Proteobacteria bacterium]|nr:hypothetical protein [Pseudomonadota bacterium]